MKSCCQCKKIGESGFVVYCDGCYDKESILTDKTIQKLTKKLEVANEKIKKLNMDLKLAKKSQNNPKQRLLNEN